MKHLLSKWFQSFHAQKLRAQSTTNRGGRVKRCLFVQLDENLLLFGATYCFRIHGAFMQNAERLERYLSRALDALDGPLSQLVYLTSLRDPYTGRYLHEGWSAVVSPAAVHSALRDAHRCAFESTITMLLPDLCNDLRRHFASLGEEESRVAKLWLETEPYYEMIPEGCPQLSRKFFISQVRVALEILLEAPNWRFLAAPVSSPFQQLDQQPLPRWPN